MRVYTGLAMEGSTRMSLPDELSVVFQRGLDELADDLHQPHKRSAGALIWNRVEVRELSDPVQSAEASGFTLALEEGKVVALSDGSLDVSDEGSVLGANELDLDLGDTTSGAGFANDLLNGGVSNFSRVHIF